MSGSWLEDAKLFVAALAATGKQFCADEVWVMLEAHSEHECDNPKTMGAVLKAMATTKRGVIAPLPSWHPSSREQDRPVRIFLGTGKIDEAYVPSNRQILWALQALESVAQTRSMQMTAAIEKARATA